MFILLILLHSLVVQVCLSEIPSGASTVEITPSEWVVDIHEYPNCEEVGVVYYKDLPSRWSGRE